MTPTMNTPENLRVPLRDIPPNRIAIEVTNMDDDEPRFVAGETLEEDAERERIGKQMARGGREACDVTARVVEIILWVAIAILLGLALAVPLLAYF